MKCPDCKGEKIILGLFPCYDESVPQSERKRYVEMPCGRCGETGEVPDIQAEWVVAGKKLKAQRMKPYRNLRDEAARRGIDVSVLSQMERGWVEPRPE